MARRKKDLERLEGTYQIIRVKKLEKMAYIPQSIAIVAIFFLFLYFTDAQIKPFYLPVYFPFFITMVWLLVLALETFAFRLMEIKYRKSESAKFLMAQRSIKKAYVIIAVMAIIFIVSAAPFVHRQIEDRASLEGELTFSGTDTVYFTTTDRFDFLFVDSITVELLYPMGNTDAEVEVMIISMEHYEANNTIMALNREVGDPREATNQTDFTFDMPRVRFDEFYIVLSSQQEVTVRYQIDQVLPNTRVLPFALLSIGFVIAYSYWIFILYNIKRRCSDETIYV